MQVFLRNSSKALWLKEFSFDGKKFYSINEKNIVRIPPFEALRAKFNKVYAGKTEVFEGHYDKNVKALALIAIEAPGGGV
jgi:hypothetical protein